MTYVSELSDKSHNKKDNKNTHKFSHDA